MIRSKNELYAYKKGYRINNLGEIVNPKNSIINGFISNRLYKIFKVRNGTKYLTIGVHRLIAYQKFGNKIFNQDIVVRHLDGNKLNNKYENIEIGSFSDNKMDIPSNIRVKMAVHANKDRKILSEEQTIELQSLYAEGYRMKFLMLKFNIKSKSSYHSYLHKKLKS